MLLGAHIIHAICTLFLLSLHTELSIVQSTDGNTLQRICKTITQTDKQTKQINKQMVIVLLNRRVLMRIGEIYLLFVKNNKNEEKRNRDTDRVKERRKKNGKIKV